MGLFNHFPYTDFHDLNLDWLLTQVKKNTEDIAKLSEQPPIEMTIGDEVVTMYTILHHGDVFSINCDSVYDLYDDIRNNMKKVIFCYINYTEQDSSIRVNNMRLSQRINVGITGTLIIRFNPEFDSSEDVLTITTPRIRLKQSISTASIDIGLFEDVYNVALIPDEEPSESREIPDEEIEEEVRENA